MSYNAKMLLKISDELIKIGGYGYCAGAVTSLLMIAYEMLDNEQQEEFVDHLRYSCKNADISFESLIGE